MIYQILLDNFRSYGDFTTSGEDNQIRMFDQHSFRSVNNKGCPRYIRWPRSIECFFVQWWIRTRIGGSALQPEQSHKIADNINQFARLFIKIKPQTQWQYFCMFRKGD